jgi:hypothetical protein
MSIALFHLDVPLCKSTTTAIFVPRNVDADWLSSIAASAESAEECKTDYKSNESWEVRQRLKVMRMNAQNRQIALLACFLLPSDKHNQSAFHFASAL